MRIGEEVQKMPRGEHVGSRSPWSNGNPRSRAVGFASQVPDGRIAQRYWTTDGPGNVLVMLRRRPTRSFAASLAERADVW